jgi:hypothetical protein
MKIGKGFIPILTLLWVLGPLGSPAQGADAGIKIEVQVDSGSGFVVIGDAIGGGSTLDVAVSPGDKVRFVPLIAGSLEGTLLEFYSTSITADDPAEIDYIEESGQELSGLGFDADLNPDVELQDLDPGFGYVESAFGSSGCLFFNCDDEPLYSVEYTVQPGIDSDSFVDFSVTLLQIITNDVDDAAATDGTETANVRLNLDPSSIPALSLNGLAVFLLLATGGLLFYRRRRAA